MEDHMTTVAKSVRRGVVASSRDADDTHEKLLISLNLPTQPEIDHLWAEEAERRISQIDKGEVRLVPGEKVLLISVRSIGDNEVLLSSGSRS